MWTSNRVKKVIYDETNNEIIFKNRESIPLVLSLLLSIANLGYCVFVKFFMVLNDDGSESIYTYTYVDTFLGIQTIREIPFGKLMTGNSFLVFLSFLSLFLRAKNKNVLNYPRIRVIKKLGKILLLPIKTFTFLFLLYLAYGGKISILSMIFRTALVIIMIQVIRQAYSNKKIKINTSNYIRFLNVLTFLYLLIFSVTLVLFHAVSASESSKESVKGVISLEVDQKIRTIKERYADKVSKVLLQNDTASSFVFFYVLNVFLYLKELIGVVKDNEMKMYSKMCKMKQSKEEDPEQSEIMKKKRKK